jgi:hypothetical protein
MFKIEITEAETGNRETSEIISVYKKKLAYLS